MTDTSSILFPSCPEIVQILSMNMTGRCCLDWDMLWWSMVTHAKTVYLCNRHLCWSRHWIPGLLSCDLLGKKVICLTLAWEIFANTCKWKALLKEKLVSCKWFKTFSWELEGHGSAIPWLFCFHYKATFQSMAGKIKVQQISIAEHLKLVTGAQVNFC